MQFDFVGYTLHMRARGLHERTMDQHFRRLKTLQKECVPFTKTNFQLYIIEKLKKSTSCANGYIKTIKSYSVHDPIEWVRVLRHIPNKYRPRIVMTNEEVEAVVNVPTKHNLYWKLLAYTGMRPGEARALTPNDIRDRSIIIRNSKTQRSRRVIPIPFQIKRMPTDFKFHTSVTYGLDLKKRLKRVGITKEITPHCFRHSFITRLLAAGVPLFAVMSIVGHKSPRSTMPYYHEDIQLKRDALNLDPISRKQMSARQIMELAVDSIEKFKLNERKDIDYMKYRRALLMLWDSAS